MKVIIAEKPSVAREIATIVGAASRKDGYLSKVTVTPLRGRSVIWSDLSCPKSTG